VERIRSIYRRSFLILAAGSLLLTGCATRSVGRVGPTTMQVALEPYPAEQQLDVGIQVFREGEVDQEAMEKQHTSRQIRKSEVLFMPYHLKTTLDQSGYWGEVKVVPENASGKDLMLEAEILSSNGEELALDVRATDSRGEVWIDRVYRDKVSQQNYEDIRRGKTGPFQNIYNAIANDLASVRRRMDTLQVRRLQRTTQILFAAELVPGAYGDYVRTGSDGRNEVVRLPAEDDPLWQKVNQVSERNRMFFDALNATYEPYYRDMWTPYADWRRYNLVEQISIREARAESIKRTAAGIIMIAAAILLEMEEVDNSSTLRDVLVLGGAQVIINGVNISKRADIHRDTLQELADSFSSDASTLRVTLEGRTVELTGNVSEQMTQWQNLLRDLHAREMEQTPLEPE
jgi:hypothetical protein